jgi:hypothetical protein
MLYIRHRRPNRLYSLPNLEEKVEAFTLWGEMPSFFRVMLSKRQEVTLCTSLFLLRIFTWKHMRMVVVTYEISINTVMEKRINFSVTSNPTKITADRSKVTIKRQKGGRKRAPSAQTRSILFF